MNKSEFLKELSKLSNTNLPTCKKVLHNTYALLCDNLKKGISVNFYGFGKFYVKCYKERFVNCGGIKKLVSAKFVPSFKTGKNFKNIIY